jgi:RHS repeat-associated protein
MNPRQILGVFLLAACSREVPAIADDVVEYYVLDAVGNVRIITDEDGDVIERHDYYPFGEECAIGACASNPGVGGGHPRKFTGKERDTETGLDYFGARYYGSRIGRFTTVDPSMTLQENSLDPQRWNRYAYGRNNPSRFVDPDGRDWLYRTVMGEQYVQQHGDRSSVSVFFDGISTDIDRAGQQFQEQLAVDLTVAGLASGLIPGGPAAPVAQPRGGIGPVLKGQAGVERALGAAKARGETILGREITLDTPAARTRVDLATKTPAGTLKFIECKNGPCAGLTPNQKRAFPEIRSGGAVPRGGNAAKAGLKPGEPIGPTEVVVERH